VSRGSERGALVGAGEPRQQIIDLGLGRGAQASGRRALRIAGDDPAPHHHVFAHRQGLSWMIRRMTLGAICTVRVSG
jgi:hypothetical protein